MDEPQTKKAKMDLDPIFKTFCEDKEKFEQLRSAVKQIKSGGQQKMIFRRINEANAREIVPFGIVPWSDATCILRFVDEDPGFVSAGVFFIPAIDILDKYCCAKAIPEDPDHRVVLSILLQYLSSYHGELLYTEAKRERMHVYKRLWTVVVAQHLVSQLAMVAVNKRDKNYIFESYAHAEMDNKCPCENGDPISGEEGDTSFGCLKGWHGKGDILLENMVVKVPDTVQAEGDQAPTAVEDAGSSVSSEEIKTELTTEMQLAAQSIVFSFLQNKHHKDRMKSRLVPAISVSLQNYQIMCYDSEQDILVSTVADSEDTELFDDTIKSLKYTSVLVLWMALNYRLLCSGVPTHSEKIRLPDVKAEFFERVGDHLYLYEEAVERPAHVSCRKSSDPPPSGQGKSMQQIFGQTWKRGDMAFEPLF